MSRKNFKAATAENGKTPTQDIKHKFSNVTKTPTGKVKTIKDSEAVKKAREEEYKNRRINSLKRRAKRIGLNEEQIKVKVKELLEQLDTPNSYDVLIFYNPNNRKIIEQALKNEELTCKIITDTYLFIEADQETLGTLREIIPPGSKIHPYVKKKPPILPVQQPESKSKKIKTKAEKKAAAKAAKKARKTKTVEDNSRRGLMCFRKRVNEMRKSKIQRQQEKEARKINEKLMGITRASKKAYTGPFTGKTSKEKKAISASMKAHRANIKKVEKARMKNFTKTRVSRKRRIIIPQTNVKAQESL